MGHYDTFEKNELKIKDIRLEGTNLHEIANCVADVYGVAKEKVLVIDVRNEEVALDIFDHNLDPRVYVGKEKNLLERVAKIAGVTLGAKASVSSEGMLGWIAFEAEQDEILHSIEAAERMADQIAKTISKRVLVYPSGTEVINGEIEDTNTPLLVKELFDAGFQVDSGSVLPDDEEIIVYKLQEAIDHGYGTIITTGGVGAEDKDHSVEAVLRLDPDAATPYIAKFQKGHGRHLKDGIRIAVGQVDHVRIVTLPGPNDEVAACIPTLKEGMLVGKDKETLANTLAYILKSRLKDKIHH